MSKYKWNNIQKLGLAIVAFEGTEHLANIITELQDCLDYVSIGLQRKSYHGDPIAAIDLAEIFRLKDEDHLVDNIVEIELDTTKLPRVQETDKRNLLIQDAEDHGCSHVIVIDSDEFYSRNSFLKALLEIDKNDYEMTYCQYINYYKDYMHTLIYPFDKGMYVPFVSKVKYRHSFECQDFPLPSDPTRRYVRPYISLGKYTNKKGEVVDRKQYTVDFHIFPWEVVKMHHLSWLRADIRKKVNVWSSKKCFTDYNNLIDKAVDVYEHFDESTVEGKASLLFNTPNHEVTVKAFPKQYIFPKYDFNNRLRQVKQEKRILILNLSSTNSTCDLFNKLDECARRTWAKDVLEGKYPNIDYYTVVDCHENSHISEDKRIIYVKTDYNKDNTQQLLQRFLIAYKLIAEKHTYDFVLRTNTSTWCNIDVLNSFLADETNDSIIYTFKFFAAFWSTFNIYCSGAAMIWPTRNIEILDNIVSKEKESFLNIALDDVMMSALWRRRAEQLKLTNPTECFCSLEGEHLKDRFDETDFSKIDLKVPMYQIKTFTFEGGKDAKNGKDHEIRLENDIKKMEELDHLWREHKQDNTAEEYAKELRENGLNKTISIIPYSKTEWIDNKNITDIDKQSAMFKNIKPFNDETVDWLEKRARECGYSHAPINRKIRDKKWNK